MDNQGWWPLTATLTRIDGKTLSIPGDKTDVIARLGKMRYKVNGVYGYWHTASVTYDALNNKTIIENVQNSNYILSNLPITEFSYSYVQKPFGWPSWFDFGPSFDGFSTPPGVICRFKIEEDTLVLYQDVFANGMSSSGANGLLYRTNLPIKSGNFGRNLNFPAAVVDNNIALDKDGFVSVWQNNDWVDVYPTWNITGAYQKWTANNYKGAAFWLECDL